MATLVITVVAIHGAMAAASFSPWLGFNGRPSPAVPHRSRAVDVACRASGLRSERLGTSWGPAADRLAAAGDFGGGEFHDAAGRGLGSGHTK